MATYSQIKTHVRNVTHKPSSVLTGDLMDTWVDALTARINDELDASVMHVNLTITPTANPFSVAEFTGGTLKVAYEILEVTYESDNGRRRLEKTSREAVTDWLRSTGDPQVYAIEGYSLYVAPFSSIEYRVLARVDAKALTSGTDANVVSNTHPNIYYYGMLMQAYEYLRDFEAADRYRVLFEQEMQRVNNEAAHRMAGANAQMSGATAWL